MNDERRPLTRARIVSRALELIDERGLAAMTMGNLGESFGVSDMALYKHYESKAALLGAVLDTVLADLPSPPLSGTWRERLRAFYLGLWGLFAAHPNALPLVTSQTLGRPLIRACVERGQELLTEAGYSGERSRAALLALTGHALGFAVLVAGGYPDLTQEAQVKGADPARQRVSALTATIDWAAAERDYARGLELVLAGIEEQLG